MAIRPENYGSTIGPSIKFYPEDSDCEEPISAAKIVVEALNILARKADLVLETSDKLHLISIPEMPKECTAKEYRQELPELFMRYYEKIKEVEAKLDIILDRIQRVDM